MIDSSTPPDARSRKGYDGEDYVLVFSDEFNVDGRTFNEGDDPYWTAVDLHFWQTNNMEWCVTLLYSFDRKLKKQRRYDPDAMTTSNGSLKITLTKEEIHDLNYRSGMIQSWNQFCFVCSFNRNRRQLIRL